MSDTLGIIPTYFTTEEEFNMTTNAIGSFLNTCDADLIVIDDASPNEELVDALDGMLDVEDRVIFKVMPKNRGFASTVNVGMREARKRGQNAVLVNADVQLFDNGWLAQMEAHEEAVVGGLLLYPNGLVQHAGIYFSVIARTFDHIYRLSPHTLDLVQKPRFCPVTGAFMFIQYETIKSIGIFDENFQMGYEDVDYCHMVFKAGKKCIYDPKAMAVHHESFFRKGKGKSKEIEKRWTASWEYLHEKHRGHGFSDYIPSMIWPDEL